MYKHTSKHFCCFSFTTLPPPLSQSLICVRTLLISQVDFSKILRLCVYVCVFGVMTFEMEVLLGVCWFVVNVCDSLAILVYEEDI